MWPLALATLLLVSQYLGDVYATECPIILSCASDPEAERADPCCVPTPGGSFVFRQRFEPGVGSDAGSWGIDGLAVLE